VGRESIVKARNPRRRAAPTGAASIDQPGRGNEIWLDMTFPSILDLLCSDREREVSLRYSQYRRLGRDKSHTDPGRLPWTSTDRAQPAVEADPFRYDTFGTRPVGPHPAIRWRGGLR
jgi:hypothetical protein